MVEASLEPFQSALDLCVESNDVEGQVTYLNNLLEAHCYLGDGQAISIAEQLLDVKRTNRLPSHDVDKRKAREAFEEVERLAPGWFRCRTDRWLSDGLDNGTISNEEFLLVRALDDGGLDAAQAIAIARQAVERFPDFAPLYLLLGDRCSEDAEATAAYRNGLELVEEPDLESRLLCALAGRLSVESPERKQLVQRAIKLEGSLVALATARLMGLQ